MSISVMGLQPRQECHQITGEDLRELANFEDQHGHAISYYYSPFSARTHSHRQELTLLQQEVKDKLHSSGTRKALAEEVRRDLDDVLAAAYDTPHVCSRLRAIFACRARRIWREFELPAAAPVRRLEMSTQFCLTPLLHALQSCSPYCLVTIAEGKAGGFTIAAEEIHEVAAAFRAADSRASSQFLADGKDYSERLAMEIQKFAALQGTRRLVVGCSEKLWKELEPLLLDSRAVELLGHFQLHDSGLAPRRLMQHAGPIFHDYLQRRCASLVREVRENPGQAAVDFWPVWQRLQEGRVETLLLDPSTNEMVAQCRRCGHLQDSANRPCAACHSSELAYTLAEEVLVRQALTRNVEIVPVRTDKQHLFGRMAALLAR